MSRLQQLKTLAGYVSFQIYKLCKYTVILNQRHKSINFMDNDRYTLNKFDKMHTVLFLDQDKYIYRPKMKTTIFMILLSVVLSLPYRYEGTYPLLKNITAMSVISKNQYDYGMPQSMIAVGTSTRSVGIYIDSISDTLQHTYGVNAPVKSLCWVLNDTLAIEMETQISFVSLEKQIQSSIPVSNLSQMKCSPGAKPYDDYSLALRYPNRIDFYGYNNNKSSFTISGSINRNQTYAISYSYYNDLSGYFYVFAENHLYMYSSIDSKPLNLSYDKSPGYTQVENSKYRDYMNCRFAYVQGSYFKIIYTGMKGDETDPIYYDLTNLKPCEQIDFLAILYKSKGNAVLDIMYWDYFSHQQSQTFQLEFQDQTPLLETYEDKIIIIDRQGNQGTVLKFIPPTLFIVWIIIGVVVLMLLIGGLIFYIYKRKKSQTAKNIDSYKKMQDTNNRAEKINSGLISNHE